MCARSASSTMPSAEAAAIIARSSSSAVALSRSASPVVPKGLAAGASSEGRLGLPTCQRRLALLVVLPGLVGEAADQGEAAELGGVDGKSAPGLAAEEQRGEAAERRA